MPNHVNVTEGLVVGAQPGPDEIKRLREQGFQTVINLRVDNEDDDMLAPIDEAKLVRDEEMTFLHLPVSTGQLRPEQVDEFRNAVEKLDAPIYAHCKLGKRAAAFAAIHKALGEGWSGERTVGELKQLGFECEEGLASFMRDYVDRRTQSAATGQPASETPSPKGLTGLQP